MGTIPEKVPHVQSRDSTFAPPESGRPFNAAFLGTYSGRTTIRRGTRFRDQSTLFVHSSEEIHSLHNDLQRDLGCGSIVNGTVESSAPASAAALPVYEVEGEALSLIEEAERRTARRVRHLAALDTAALDYYNE